MELPLSDIVVVALEQAVAAPLCTSRLADAGARVIKIERPEGDFARGYDQAAAGASAYFVWINRGKESICLDIKEARDADLLHSLVAGADVFIQNLAPGAAARAGFDSQLLRGKNDRLITVDITGYGDSGVYRDMKAYDLLVQCETGLAAITGGPEQPGRVGVSVSDIACGMNAHAGILEALLERERTGLGKGLSVSLFDATADWMTVPLLQQEHAGRPPARVGLNHPSIAPYGAYRCQDGELIVISIQNDREWSSFCCHILGSDTLATDARFDTNLQRCAHRAALDAVINKVFAQHQRADLAQRLLAANIAFGAVNSVAELARHPQLRRVAVDTPCGTVDLVAPPVRVSGEPVRLRPVPALGEHGAAIRQEFDKHKKR